MKLLKSNSISGNQENNELDRVSGFSLIYDQYSPLIWKHIFLRVSSREETNDLTAEVFLKTWEYLKSGKKIRQIRSFLYRVANNLVIDWYRSRKPVISLDQELTEGEFFLETEAKIEERLSFQEEKEVLLAKLNQLKEKEKTLLILRFVDELEIEEIAKVLGKSRGAIRVGLHRALKSLAQLEEAKLNKDISENDRV